MMRSFRTFLMTMSHWGLINIFVPIRFYRRAHRLIWVFRRRVWLFNTLVLRVGVIILFFHFEKPKYMKTTKLALKNYSRNKFKLLLIWLILKSYIEKLTN